MKNLLSLLAAGVVAASAAVSSAQPPAPMPDPVAGAHAAGAPVELFHCVKYRDVNNIACCAKPMVVEVRDPCWKPDPCNPCCKPPCVKVKVCLPDGCCPPEIKCSKDGKHVRIVSGKYAADVRTKRDHVEVDYDK